jgi:Domain of unknown function (DUF4381)
MQAELRDIHLPGPVSWWPPAPGWYGVALLFIFLIITGWWLIHKRRNPSLKKLATRELQQIEQTYAQHQNTQQLCSDISILLRRIAMSYDSRNKQAGVTGKEWLNHLNTLCGQPLFDEQLSDFLLLAPYQKHTNAPADKLIAVTQQWISRLPSHFFLVRLFNRRKTSVTPTNQPVNSVKLP